ncbi:hypothetical protein QVD17_28654 [Tagetes erecta]|uniref:Uncharacterized protein n=1 Tax=Tagetes erecta TaxID=13708 RepID=A0AAD8KAT2_TARER|nr:hypothetical protein QVD17_28654 [Tagetes erecta]
MGRRKRQLITSVVVNEPIEDHVEDNLEDHFEDYMEDYFEDREAFEAQEDQTANEQGAPKRVPSIGSSVRNSSSSVNEISSSRSHNTKGMKGV